jgi:Fe2+ or Zn2+ uptake regulation protein
MVYNRKNLLKTVLFVQDFYIEQNRKGIPNTKIIEQLKEKNIHISLATFYNYLAIPAKRELKELAAKEKEQSNDKNTLHR